MALLFSGSVAAFADRRLLHVDASDASGLDDLGEADMSFEGTRLSPLGSGCLLLSDEERLVQVSMAVHDGPADVREGSESCVFGGKGSTVALRGLFGDPYLVLSAVAPRWRLSARFWPDTHSWNLVLWPEH